MDHRSQSSEQAEQNSRDGSNVLETERGNRMNPSLTTETIIESVFRKLCAALVDHVEMILTSVHLYGRSLLLSARLHVDDRGKIIGSGGVTVAALETVLSAIGSRDGLTVRVSVSDQVLGKESNRRPSFKPAVNWNSGPIAALLREVAFRLFSEPVVTAQDDWDCTILSVRPNEKVSGADADRLSTALTVIFRAIGKAKGRNEIIVNVE